MTTSDDGKPPPMSETRSFAQGERPFLVNKLDLENAQQIVGERYRLEHVAGEGGMGCVFTAHDTRLDRRVAIKFLTGPIGPQARETLLAEARAMAGLRHPSIAPVHEAVVDSDVPFIVMGWIDGLEMDVAWRDIDLDARVTMVERVMDAVAELHDSNLVHLDIKPKNILVDRFGVPVLVDFGLARALAGAPNTSSGGTPGYAAPEQFARGTQPGPTADVHALGVLLFKAITNQLPWESNSARDLLTASKEEPPRLPEDLAPGAPWPLQRITMAALEHDPGQRYPHARAMIRDLQRYQRGEAVAARPSQLTSRFEEQVRRRQEETTNWERQGLVTTREAAVLERIYERIQRPESHWIVDSRRLSTSQVLLYLGGWIILLSTTIGMYFIWEPLEEVPWLRWMIPSFMAAGTITLGIILRRLGQRRIALGYLFTACLLLPVATGALIVELEWFEPDFDRAQFLELVLDIPPLLSNTSLMICGGILAAVSFAFRQYLRANAFSILAVFGLCIAMVTGWGALGLLGETPQRWALLGVLLLMMAAAFLAVGIPLNLAQQNLDRRHAPGGDRLFDAWAVISGGVILTLIGLTLLAWNVPSYYLPGILPEAQATDGSMHQHNIDNQSRAAAFMINGVLLIGLSVGLGRVKTTACARLAELIRWVIPAHIIGGLLALEQHSWNRAIDLDELPRAAWFWLASAAGASIAFTIASVHRQWRPFLVSGLLGLAYCFLGLFVRLNERLETETFETTAIWLVVIFGMVGIGIMILSGRLPSRTRESEAQ